MTTGGFGAIGSAFTGMEGGGCWWIEGEGELGMVGTSWRVGDSTRSFSFSFLDLFSCFLQKPSELLNENMSQVGVRTLRG